MKIHGALALCALVALGGCHLGWPGHAGTPTGQVVATVGNREITLSELRGEMAGVLIADPAARKQAQQAALHNLIDRAVLAKAAVDQGVDKAPDFVIAKRRAMDGLLVQALQNKLASQTPTPTRQDADRFIAGHADIFAQRKVFVIDQLRMARPTDPLLIAALRPLKSLAQVEALLKSNRVAYQRSVGNLDAVGADPRMIDAMTKLAPGEMFIVPNNDTLLVNQIRQVRVVPFTGQPAVSYALGILTTQRTQETLARQFNALISKAAHGVRFNKDYAPPTGSESGA